MIGRVLCRLGLHSMTTGGTLTEYRARRYDGETGSRATYDVAELRVRLTCRRGCGHHADRVVARTEALVKEDG